MDLINTEGLVFEDLKPQAEISRRDLYLNRATTCFLASELSHQMCAGTVTQTSRLVQLSGEQDD